LLSLLQGRFERASKSGSAEMHEKPYPMGI